MVGPLSIGDVNLPAPLNSFASDNAAGVHPEIMASLASANVGSALAYGQDVHTSSVQDSFRRLFGSDVETLFVFGGTGGNVLALAGLMEAGDAILCTDTAHIHVDEAGAPERVLSAKVVAVPHTNGKLTVQDVHDCVSSRSEVHHPRVGVISLTQVTEMGTIYTADEIKNICTAAHELGLKVHLDGARIANAVAATEGLPSLRAMTVDAGIDALTFGAAKNGAMFGEAVVFFGPTGKKNLGYIRKQLTQLPSKMRYVSAQFEALLTDDLWLRNAQHANSMATLLWESLQDLSQLRLERPAANSLFPTIDAEVAQKLQQWSFFWPWNPHLSLYRWMTSWQTTSEDIERFAAGVRSSL